MNRVTSLQVEKLYKKGRIPLHITAFAYLFLMIEPFPHKDTHSSEQTGLKSHWGLGTSSIINRDTEFQPVYPSESLYPGQFPMLIATRILPLWMFSQ